MTKTYSGMPLVVDDAFLIEDTASYTSLRGGGIKSVEFVRRKGSTLLFVEAKTTFPSPSTGGNFDSESVDIVGKFVHSLNLFAAISMNLYKEDISATETKTVEKTSVTLVLVVRDHKSEWCKEIKKKFMLLLNSSTYITQIWRPEVYVVNYDAAIKRGIATT